MATCCLYCTREIGWFRSQFDDRFCCADHAKLYGTRSARAVREVEHVLGYGELWSDDAPSHQHRGSARSGLVFLGLALAVSCGLAWLAPDRGSAASGRARSPEPEGRRSAISAISKAVRGRETVRLQANFEHGFADWKDGRPGAEWTVQAGAIRPGRLRIWGASESLADYEFEFLGQIERKSMSWAFRAADPRNYYAAKLALAGGPAQARSELVRYVVLDGRVFDRVELPLPLNLGKGADYRVHLSVRGNTFLTSVDGRVVSSWSDVRITRGGVGFFSEEGESSLLKWASLAERRESLMDRVWSYFSILMLRPGVSGVF